VLAVLSNSANSTRPAWPGTWTARQETTIWIARKGIRTDVVLVTNLAPLAEIELVGVDDLREGKPVGHRRSVDCILNRVNSA